MLQLRTHDMTVQAPATHLHVALTLAALHFMTSRLELNVDLLAAFIVVVVVVVVTTPTDTVGVGKMFGPVCLFVCMYSCDVTQK